LLKILASKGEMLDPKTNSFESKANADLIEKHPSGFHHHLSLIVERLTCARELTRRDTLSSTQWNRPRLQEKFHTCRSPSNTTNSLIIASFWFDREKTGGI
jgi:hypothetical protein